MCSVHLIIDISNTFVTLIRFSELLKKKKNLESGLTLTFLVSGMILKEVPGSCDLKTLIVYMRLLAGLLRSLILFGAVQVKTVTFSVARKSTVPLLK